MQALDSHPIAVVIAGFVVVALACYETGFRLGRWWQARMPGEQEGPTGVIVGTLPGLMAFLLAITMGMASDRFDARRGLVLSEANAIRTTYLQADYLPPDATVQLKGLLREYLPLRIATDDRARVAANIEASVELHRRMWAIVAEAAAGGWNPDLMASPGDSLTDLATLHETGVVSAFYARVPETVLLLLLAGSALSLGMVGYSAGLAGRRSMLSGVVLIVDLGAVLALVIDLDRPQDGVLRVSQQALLDAQAGIGAPPR